jgi:hypothetical protein
LASSSAAWDLGRMNNRRPIRPVPTKRPRVLRHPVTGRAGSDLLRRPPRTARP